MSATFSPAQEKLLAAASSAGAAATDMVEALRDGDIGTHDMVGSGDTLTTLVDAVRLLIQAVRLVDPALPGGNPTETDDLLKAVLDFQEDNAADGVNAPGKWTPGVDGLPPDCPVVPLGTANGVYFFRDTIGQFRALKACEFGTRAITSLFHGRARYLYWAWPRQNAMGEVSSWKAEKAAEALMAACAFKGIWKATDPAGWSEGGDA